MCGFAGFMEAKAATSAEGLLLVLERMTDKIIRRGPDDLGMWTDPAKGVALGFRRLSILDLSPDGHQPMLSQDGNLILLFNGEIYNHAAIRAELAILGHTFRGHSDTEVILAAFTEWGFKVSVERFNGMFAIALWDRSANRMHLFRDRVGKKPLYYGWQGGTFFFGSQLAALRVHPAFQAILDLDALGLYLRHNYVPGPHSIFQGIRKLTPGCWLSVDPERPGFLAKEQPYWDPGEVMLASLQRPPASEPEAVEELHHLLLDATGKRMVADVPVGAFLSGGIDSSLVAALMQAQSSRPIRTFTIGFQEAGFDEAPFAKAVAAHLGTQHTEVYLSEQDALAVIPTLPLIFDEPFSDTSQIPTWLVSKVARQDVTVALSGDGGDELFAGYHRYRKGMRLWDQIGWMPAPLRATLAGSLRLANPDQWDRCLAMAGQAIPGLSDRNGTGQRLHRIANLLQFQSFPRFYRECISHLGGKGMVLGAHEAASPYTSEACLPAGLSPLQAMQYLDFIQYLPDDILVKVDRASMDVSLEVRAPILDHRVVEHAWRFPDVWKSRQGASKQPLRQILSRYVPCELTDRPKMGFSFPLEPWLRGPLRPWAAALLDPVRLRQDGIFDAERILEHWRDFLAGNGAWANHLWVILMFNAWFDVQ